MISTSSSELDVIQNNLTQDLNNLSSWFRDNERIINLKKGKTEVMLFGTGKRLNQLHESQLTLSVNGTPIHITTSHKYLGVYLDPTLNFDKSFSKSTKR